MDFAAVVITIGMAVGLALVGAEVKGWWTVAARAVVRRAARRVPPAHFERYSEEWLAEVEACSDRPFTALLYGARIHVRSRALRSALDTARPEQADGSASEIVDEPVPDHRLRWAVNGGPYAVTSARIALSDFHDLVDESTAFDVRLLVSELITNATRHAGVGQDETIDLSIEIFSDILRVSVDDHGPGFTPPEGTPEDIGWGFFFVAQLTSRWGASGGRVWFEIDLESRSPAH